MAPAESSLQGYNAAGGGGGPDALRARRVPLLGVKKGKMPSHLRGETTPLSQEEAEDSVDSDDDEEKDPKGASDNSDSEDAVDDKDYISFKKKSNVVELNSALESHWIDALHFDRDVSSSSSSTGVKKLIKKWGGGENSAFRPLKEDPCLSSSFDKLRGKEKQHLEFRNFSESIAGASAHASLSALVAAKEGLDAAREARRQIEAGASVSPDAVCDLLSNFEDALRKSVIAPLKDNVNLQAALGFKAVSTTRKNLLAVVNSSTKSVIEKKKPESRFFFGNPESEVNARFNQDYMESNSKSSSSSSASAGFKKGGFNAYNKGRFQHHKRATSSSNSNAASSSSSSSSASSSAKSSSSGFKKPSFRQRGPPKASK